MRAIAAIPALGLLAGSAAGLVAPAAHVRVGVALLALAAIAVVWAWRASNATGVAVAAGCAFLIGGALLSMSAWQRAWRPSLFVVFEQLARRERTLAESQGRRLPEDDEAFAIVSGRLRADAAATPTGVSLTLDAEAIRASGGSPDLQVTGGLQATVIGSLAIDRMAAWRAGRRIRAPFQLHRPSRYLDPDVPDAERALARRGTRLVGTVKSGASVELLANGSRADEAAAAVRAMARRSISRAVGAWSARSSAIVAAIVIGDRAGLDDEVQRRLQEAGTYHVIAISGGNIAILAGLLVAAFRAAGMLGRLASLSAIALLAAYAHLVGGGASVERATLMAAVYFAARVIDQRSPPLNTLAFAAACLIAADPLSVIDPAFVLTVGATFAIVLAMPALRGWNVPRRLAPLVGLFAASAATELMLMPVGGLVFARVTFAGLLLNFAAIPLMAIVQVSGMALVPLALISTRAAGMLGCVAHVSADALVRTAEWVRYAPLLSFRVAPPRWWVVVFYYAALAGAVGWTRSRWRMGAAAAGGAAAMWIVLQPWTLPAARGDGRLHVTFIDVGQGDAALVRFPRGHTLLVDAGGLTGPSSFDIGDRVVAPVIRAAGIRRLDVVALTHGDPDHIGGAASVIREFRPREVWEGVGVPRFEPLRALRSEAESVRAVWKNVRTNDRAFVDGVEAIVRSPDGPDWERQRVRNDDSIVLELRWRDVSVVLTGDIGKAVERGLLTSIPAAPLRLIKVPHHGSLTSSTTEFVRALAPRLAVVSAGRANHFGHPVPEVLERYREAGAAVFRTDQDGAVTVDSDGHSFTVTTFTEPQRTRTYEPQRAEPQRAQRAQRK